jgi:hypothetical protein
MSKSYFCLVCSSGNEGLSSRPTHGNESVASAVDLSVSKRRKWHEKDFESFLLESLSTREKMNGNE